MYKKKLHVIANSHIDPVWLWDKYEGIDEVINTFKSACDRLDEYPELKFTASSIIFYKWVQEYAPKVFERIKEHVANERWEVVGDWLVEADCNLPLTASFVNSAHISKNFTRENLGTTSLVAYSPDTFGHPASLPTILTETGYKYYLFSRPNHEEKPDLPGNLFYWEHQGNRVLCQRLKYHYTQGRNLDRERLDQMLDNEELYYQNLGCYFFGVGNHGGGPTKKEIELLHSKRQDTSNPILQFSFCSEYFQEAEKLDNIPTYSGDLHFHAVGCYSVNRGLKHALRSAERALCKVESVAKIAKAADCSTESLWEKVIFNEFHDILPGSSAPDPYVDAVNEIGGVLDSSANLSYSALKKLSADIPVAFKEGEFRILNSLDHPVTGPFEIESFMYFEPNAAFKDINDREIEIQEITPSVHCANRRWLFIDTVPAKTMNRYYFASAQKTGTAEIRNVNYVDGNAIEKGEFKIDVDTSSIRVSNEQFSAALCLGVIEDSSDTWSHGIKGYGESTDHFVLESSTVHNGSIATYLFSKHIHQCSSAEILCTLFKDLPFADIAVKVNWSQKQSILKLEISPDNSLEPLLVQCAGGYAEKKTDGCEEPLHGWILAGTMGILQNGAFAYDRIGSKLRVTLVRSSVFGFHDPWKIDYNAPVSHTDQGEHFFKFRIFSDKSLNPEIMDAKLNAMLEPFKVMRENR